MAEVAEVALSAVGEVSSLEGSFGLAVISLLFFSLSPFLFFLFLPLSLAGPAL